MRIFIGLVEIVGYYRGLKAGFDELGIETTFIDLSFHRFGYGGADRDRIVKLIKICVDKRVRALRRITQVWWYGLQCVLQAVLFFKVLNKHDVFIFGYRSTFFFYFDLPILKLFNKKVIYQFHGADSRPPYLCGSIMAKDRGLSIRECVALSKKQKKAVRVIERYADFVINTPPQGHFHERPFVLWLQIGLPCRPASATYTEDLPRQEANEIRILHAPSHPEAKGSPKIQESVANLKAKGYRIDFVQIEGQPNYVVLEELRRCDFVVDQVYADYGMPGFPTEAAWLSKPAVVGGYAKELWEELLPPEKVPPTHYCHPDDIERAIEKLIVDRPYRLDLGRRAKTFVEDQWTPRLVAERYLRLATGVFPEAWLYDPKQIRYLQGCALPESRARELVRAVIDQGGDAALQLTDKPELEQLFVRFARGEVS